jgi:hypothetical protein
MIRGSGRGSALRTMSARASFVAAIALAISGSWPATASVAGTYQVRGCWGWGRGGDGWTAFIDDPSSTPAAPNAITDGGVCGRPDGADAGLVAEVRGAWSPLGSSVGWTFGAPPETVLIGLEGQASVTDGVNVGLSTSWVAEAWNVNGARLALFPSTPFVYEPLSASGFATQRITIGLMCRSGACRGPTIYGETAYELVMLRHIVVTVRDDVAPTIGVGQPPPDDWRRDARLPVSFSGSDNVGVGSLELLVDGRRVAGGDRGCYSAASNGSPLPCAGPASLAATFDVDSLPDGAHELLARAVDVAGNISDRVFRVLVDHQAPMAPRGLVVARGTGWQSQNDFDVAWSNPPNQGGGPIAVATYSLCPAADAPEDESRCVRGERRGESIARLDHLAVPTSGAWRLRVALADAAGNIDEDRAATMEFLRLDTDRPVATFLPFDPADPTRVRLNAGDATSGLDKVEIEARRRGERSWRSLDLAEAESGIAAVLDDEVLPDGTYDLRAHVVDRAGNERTTTALADGTPLTAQLPVRAGSALTAGRLARVRVAGSRGARPRYRRVLLSRPAVRYGQSVALSGRLVDGMNKPRSNAVVEVLERVDLPGSEWRSVITVATNATGAFRFRAPAGPARVLRFRYVGTPTLRPVSDEVELRVRAGVTLVPNHESVRNGEAVVFRGRVLGRPIPVEGKLLALQARTARGWRTFATPRARGGDGRWTYRYHFTDTTATARYAFRVVVPTEASYPFARGSSAVARVLVRGA